MIGKIAVLRARREPRGRCGGPRGAPWDLARLAVELVQDAEHERAEALHGGVHVVLADRLYELHAARQHARRNGMRRTVESAPASRTSLTARGSSHSHWLSRLKMPTTQRSHSRASRSSARVRARRASDKCSASTWRSVCVSSSSSS